MSIFTAYVDLLCVVNRLLTGSIVPEAANAAALQLTPVLLNSQIPAAIIPSPPSYLSTTVTVIEKHIILDKVKD